MASAVPELEGAPPPPPISVAIIDDSAPVRAMLRALLEQDGRFAVIGEADNGRDGLELVKVQRPDAVLLDLSMPELDGLRSIPKIKDSCSHTKVVVLSAAGRALTADAFEAGADAYFGKSEPLDHVLLALGQLFAPRPSRSV